MLNRYRIEIKWALIFVMVSLAWMVLERLAGLHDEHIALHPMLTMLFAIPAIVMYVLALLDKRKNHYGGTMTYGQGFMSGLLITAIVTVLGPLTQLITSHVITPDYFANAIRYAVEQGKMTEDEATAYFSTPNYIVQGLIWAPVMGLLTTAIVALFVKRGPR